MHTLQETERAEAKQALRRADIWSIVAAALLAAFYFATSIYIASHRLLWHDEIVTLDIARLPHWTTIWAALTHAPDDLPPPYYMVVRWFDSLPMRSEVAARLPSALGLVAGLWLTFDCARRLANGLYGLIALSILTCSFLPYYGYEARSYALYFMFSALALWIWTCTRNDRWSSATFFGVALLLGITMHYYAFICLTPYALYEVSRWRPWRRPSEKLIGGVLGVAGGLALVAWVILPFARQFSHSFSTPPSFDALRTIFPQLFPDSLLLLAVILVWIALVGRADKAVALPPMQPAEYVGWLFLSIPLAGFVVAELKTNAFADRYFIGAIPGVAVAFSCWLWRHFRNASLVPVGVFLLLATCGIAKQEHVMRHWEAFDKFNVQIVTRQYMELEPGLHSDGKRFFVFPANLYYAGLQYYSKYPENCIMLLREGDVRQGHLSMLRLAQYHPFPFWKLDDLKQHARETALVMPTPGTLQAMKQAGFKVEVRSSGPVEVVYLQ